MAFQLNAYLNTTAQVDILTATHDVKRALRESAIGEGLLTVYIPSSTAGVVILEGDNDIKEALKNQLTALFETPSGARPSRKSGTGHKESHLKAAYLNRSVVIPIKDGKLLLGPWQEVLVYDFDDKIGRCEIQIHIMGEAPKK